MPEGSDSFTTYVRGDPCEYVDEHYIVKTRYIVLPASKDGIILRSFVLTQYRRVTDRQTDRNATANTARSIAARHKNAACLSLRERTCV